MKPDSSTADVAAVVRSKIQAGTLTTETPTKVWVGKGTGQTCDGCGVRVTSADIEYETDLPGGRTLRFHQRCLTVWHEQRVKDPASQASQSTTPPSVASREAVCGSPPSALPPSPAVD